MIIARRNVHRQYLFGHGVTEGQKQRQYGVKSCPAGTGSYSIPRSLNEYRTVVFVRSAGDGGDEDSRAQPSSVGQNPESSMARRWDHPMTERTPVTNGYIGGSGGGAPCAAMACPDSGQIRLRNAYANWRENTRRGWPSLAMIEKHKL